MVCSLVSIAFSSHSAVVGLRLGRSLFGMDVFSVSVTLGPEDVCSRRVSGLWAGGVGRGQGCL